MYIAVTVIQNKGIVSEIENIFYNIAQTDYGENGQWPECEQGI